MKKFNKKSIAVAIVSSFVFGLIGPHAALAAGPATVNLGSAGNYVILAKTGVSTTGSTSVVGDIGLSPAAASYITGFALALPAASAFSTSALVNGKVYAPGYADPTPTKITTAVGDMQTAYTDAAGRTNPTATELGAGNIGGMTLAPGLYKWGTGVTIPTDVTLSGGANDVWVFQIAQNLDISSGKKVILSGGAQAGNVFWQVAGQVTLGTTSEFNGNILGQTAIVLNTGAKLTGRALAQSAVTLDSSTVTIPLAASASVSSNSSGNVSDTTPPINTSIAINGGVTTTTSASVILTLAASDSSQVTNVMISNDPTFAGRTWETYTSYKAWTLAPGDGSKTVYVQYRDGVGNTTSVISAMINLNTTSGAVAPVTPPPSSTIAQNVALQAQIDALNIAIRQSLAGRSGNVPSGILRKALNIGARGNEVTVLQNFLRAHGDLTAQATGYFGPLTLSAVQKFQVRTGITTVGGAGYGNVGPKTLAKINELNR